MPNYNQIILIGNLTRDVEVKYTPTGEPVGDTGIAVNRKWRNKKDEDCEDVMFIDLTFFGRTAETAGQYLKKGSAVMIEGRLKLEQWDDKQSGAKRSKHKVVVNTMQFLDGKPQDEKPVKRAVAPPSKRHEPSTPVADSPQLDNQDDVPF